jgi:hypothetical protein
MIKDIIKYGVTEAAVAEMKNQFMPLVINDIDDKESFDAVHNARMVVKNHRVSIEKKRKELKADALEYGRKVDSEAKRITALLEPIETHLQTEEDKVINEKKRIQKEKEEAELARVNGIRHMIEVISNHSTVEYNETSEALEQRIKLVTVMEIDEKYMEFREEAQSKKDGVLARLNEALAERKEYEQEQARQALVLSRQDALLSLGMSKIGPSFSFDGTSLLDESILNSNDDVFARVFEETDKTIRKMKEAKAEIERKQKEEAERLEKQKKEQAEAQRLIDEENKRREEARKAEEEKLRLEREAFEKEKAELARQKEAERMRRIQSTGLVNTDYDTLSFGSYHYSERSLLNMDDDMFDAEIKRIINEIEAEKTRLKKEQEEKEAKLKAEAEKAAQEKLEREQREKEEKEERERKRLAKIEARKPDKQKLDDFSQNLLKVINEYPQIKDPDIQDILANFIDDMDKVISKFKEELKAL